VSSDDWRRVEELFHAALDRRREERADFLARSCRGDDVLRARIESLLSSHEEAGSFLEVPALVLGDEPVPEDPAGSLVGQRVARYLVRGEIATGGMGVVYLAEQENPRREVALKVIRSDLVSPQALRRFEREAQLLGRLQHPGIAQIFEAGAADIGQGAQPFLAMELVRGRPLVEYAETTGLGVRERLALFVQVCDAVHHAHERRITHRDLKPANILVDGSGQPKILDFGIAQGTDSDLKTTSLRTGAGQIMGTIAYMSPEQVAGDAWHLDHRSDIYSLGVLFYELLAGRLPYEVRRAAIEDAVRIITSVPPAPLGLVDGLPAGDLEAIARKALQKDRSRRYQSAADLSLDIRRYLRQEPIAMPPSGALRAIRVLATAHRLVATVAIVLFLAASALAFLVAAQASRAARERARLARVAAFLNDTLIRLGVPGGDGSAVPVRQILDEAARRLESELGGQPEVAAPLRRTIGSGYRSLGLYDLAEGQFRAALATQRRTLGKHDPAVAATLDDLAGVLGDKGDYDEAESLARESLQIQRQGRPTDPLAIAEAEGVLGGCLTARGRYAEAEPLLVGSFLALRTIPGGNDPRTAESLRRLVELYKRWGRSGEADRYLALVPRPVSPAAATSSRR
jgi:eukaryotic-like serine/threonine-protein kinase